MSFILVFHPCYRTTLEGGYRVYLIDDQYLSDNPSMYIIIASFDTYQEAETKRIDLENEWFQKGLDILEEDIAQNMSNMEDRIEEGRKYYQQGLSQVMTFPKKRKSIK